MKKIVCVLLLVAFLGSTVIMTGCFGGSDSVLGIALFALAITASGGSAAGAFAANVRGASIATTSYEITMVIQPLTDAGEPTGAAITIPETDITYAAGTYTATKNIEVSATNQYRIEVRAGSKMLTKGIKYLRAKEKTGTQNTTINTTSTAKAMVYEEWVNNVASASFGKFEYNLNATDNTNITNLGNQVNINLNAAPISPDYSTLPATAQTYANGVTTNPILYSMLGEVKAVDGTGANGHTITVTGTSLSEPIITTTSNGSYEVWNLPAGTYTVTPSMANHTYTPTNATVVVSEDTCDTSRIVTVTTFQAAH